MLDAPVSFQEKETGAGWRTRNGQAERLLLSRWVGWLPQGNDIELASITWVVTVRAAGRESYLRVNHRGSGVTFKVRVTWVLSSTALATPGLRLWTIFVKQRDIRDLAPVDKTIPRWTSVVFHRRTLCQQFFSQVYGPFKRGGFAAPFERTRAEELNAALWVTSQRV